LLCTAKEVDSNIKTSKVKGSKITASSNPKELAKLKMANTVLACRHNQEQREGLLAHLASTLSIAKSLLISKEDGDSSHFYFVSLCCILGKNRNASILGKRSTSINSMARIASDTPRKDALTKTNSIGKIVPVGKRKIIRWYFRRCCR
jgi:hypothetical protein